MIIRLQAGDYTAFINPERGANCISLRNSKYKAIILRELNKSGVLVICTPKVRQFWRCIFLWVKQEEKIKF